MATVAEIQVCATVGQQLSVPRLQRQAVVEAGQALLSIEHDLERRVKALMATQGQTSAAQQANVSLRALKNSLRWIEANRYGGFQSELHRQVAVAHRCAEEILSAQSVAQKEARQAKGGVLSRFFNRSAGWDGIERRDGLDRRREIGPGPRTSVPFEQRHGRDRRRRAVHHM